MLTVARLAGVQAAKQTAQLIPLAHPLPLSFVDVEASVDVDAGVVELVAEARTSAGTGVEMEAMTAAAVAALTVYDMVKGIERGIEIEQVVLLEKRGGRSGHYVYDGDGSGPARADAPASEAPAHAAKAGAALVTISTSKAAGRGEDESGPRLAALAAQLGLEVLTSEVIPDDPARIEALLRTLADERRCALILTSGGTGVAPTDVTPQATRAVIDVEVEGLGEAMRAVSRPHTGNWMLSRALAGTRDGTLIVNLPGSPAAIEQIGAELLGPLRHALALLAGGDGGHPPGGPAKPLESAPRGDSSVGRAQASQA